MKMQHPLLRHATLCSLVVELIWVVYYFTGLGNVELTNLAERGESALQETELQLYKKTFIYLGNPLD